MTKPTADPEPKKKSAENDPVLSSFLSFLASDMQRFPARIRPLDRNILDRIGT
ncbi:MAG: type II toxin-antitoxin system PrlF family antitoxin, partial [Ktedonobacteraceae bacterium]